MENKYELKTIKFKVDGILTERHFIHGAHIIVALVQVKTVIILTNVYHCDKPAYHYDKSTFQ